MIILGFQTSRLRNFPPTFFQKMVMKSYDGKLSRKVKLSDMAVDGGCP